MEARRKKTVPIPAKRTGSNGASVAKSFTFRRLNISSARLAENRGLRVRLLQQPQFGGKLNKKAKQKNQSRNHRYLLLGRIFAALEITRSNRSFGMSVWPLYSTRLRLRPTRVLHQNSTTDHYKRT